MISQKKAALKCKPRGSGFNRGRKKSESQTGEKTKEKEGVKGDRLFELSLGSRHRERFHGPDRSQRSDRPAWKMDLRGLGCALPGPC